MYNYLHACQLACKRNIIVLACMHVIQTFLLQTMKIMLVVVVLVACFAAVNCQGGDLACVSAGVLNNQNLQTCSTMLAVSSPIISIQHIAKFFPCTYTYRPRPATHATAFCALSCVRDFAALYDTCNVTPNTIRMRKYSYNKYKATQCMHVQTL